MKKTVLLTVIVILTLASKAIAELRPENVLILANSNSEQSLQVARTYQKLRAIPEKNLISLKLQEHERIRREDFEKTLLEPLKKEIIKRDLVKQIKVITTIYGVPLHVLQPEIGPEQKEIGVLANERRAQAKINIEENVKKIQKIAREEQNGFIEIPENKLPNELQNLLKRANKGLKNYKGEELKKTQLTLASSLQELGGHAILTKILKPNEDPSKKAKSEAELQKLKQEIQANVVKMRELGRSNKKSDVTLLFNLTKKTLGSLGILSVTDKINSRSIQKEADASLDSELSLIWWGENSFPLGKWLSNPLNHKVLSKEILKKMGKKIIMVSRIDAPDAWQAIRIIKDSIKAEKEGLNGKAYIDTRKLGQETVLGIFDGELKDLGWYLREKTNYKVKLDIFPELIKKAHDVALYAGWYSVRNFQGDFKLNPGSIAWHVASAEAVSLRDPEEKGWCKNLIDRGASVTIGAVGEPYLAAFPRPKEFFGFLLTGKYTLVEAYFLTKRYLSWKLVLIGDPLYKPFKVNSDIKLSDFGITNTLKPSEFY